MLLVACYSVNYPKDRFLVAMPCIRLHFFLLLYTKRTVQELIVHIQELIYIMNILKLMILIDRKSVV